MAELISPGDLPSDIELKKEFYFKIKNNKNIKNAIMITKCYYNNLKYKCRYPPEIEKYF
jgi:hypothetical protein